MSFKNQLIVILEKILEEQYDLVSVEFLNDSGKRMRIQVMVDRLDNASITHDDCVAVTKMIKGALSNEIEENYTLEVSSPGVHRPLNKPAHFMRFKGQNIRFKWNNEKREGVIKNANSEGVELESGENIMYQEIKDARLYII